MNGLDVFAVTLPLANRLQFDIASALSHATKVIETLKALRSAAENGFKKVFCDAQLLAAKNGYRDHTSANCGSPNSQLCRQY